MLVESPYSLPNLKEGDSVKIKNTGVHGKIVRLENGQWLVETTNGERMLFPSNGLEKKEILHG